MSTRDHLDVPGARLYYEVEGDGPAFTLVHAGVAHLRQWDGIVPALAERYRVIRYDTRGFGRTTNDDVEFSNRDDIRDLLDHLGVERTHLLGHSRSGSIAVDFALESPERVHSLIVIAGGISGFDAPRPDWASAMLDEMERAWEAKDWPRLVAMEVDYWVNGPGQPSDRVDPDVRRRMTEWGLENYAGAHPEGRPRTLQPPAAGRLDEIAVPTLIVWGDLDDPATQVANERLADEIPGARRHVFPGVAHMVNLERPHEFERLVLDFLSDVDARRESAA